jgi:addiction module HigA family antidote
MTRTSISPGEILLEEYLQPLGWSAADFARRSGLTLEQVEGVIAGQLEVTPDVALAIARVFDTSTQLWVNMQTHYDRTRDGSAERFHAAMRKVLREDAGAFAALARWDLRHTSRECCDPRALCPNVSVSQVRGDRGYYFVARLAEPEFEVEAASAAEALGALGREIDRLNERKLRGEGS